MQDQAAGTLDSTNTMLSENEVTGFMTTIDTVWNELYPMEQHRVMRALVDQVIVT